MGVGVRGAGVNKKCRNLAEIFLENQQKVLCLCGILQMQIRPLYEGMNFCGRKSTKFKKNIVKNPI